MENNNEEYQTWYVFQCSMSVPVLCTCQKMAQCAFNILVPGLLYDSCQSTPITGKEKICLHFNQAYQSRGSHSFLYKRTKETDAILKSLLKDKLNLFTLFGDFLSPQLEYLEIGNEHFLLHSFKFITHYNHGVIWCYTIWTTDSIADYTINKRIHSATIPGRIKHHPEGLQNMAYKSQNHTKLNLTNLLLTQYT